MVYESVPVAPIIIFVVVEVVYQSAVPEGETVTPILILSVPLPLPVTAVATGNTFTVPLTDTFCELAPLEVIVIVPVGVPVAELVSRA